MKNKGMRYNTREVDSYTVIELQGEVDLSCSPEARKQILDQLSQKKHLLVDLSAVTYIDSSGVASLAGLARRDPEHRGEEPPRGAGAVRRQDRARRHRDPGGRRGRRI